MNSHSQPSSTLDCVHGEQVTDLRCRQYPPSGQYKAALYTSTSTIGVIHHLKHRLEEFEHKSVRFGLFSMTEVTTKCGYVCWWSVLDVESVHCNGNFVHS